MPHAEQKAMPTPTVNGEKPSSSAFLEHLNSYPIISDSISTFKSNPFGQKSISLADQGYATFAKPILPYLAKPYQYVSPYVTKADSLADSGLSTIDSRFPIVKKPTSEIKSNVTNIAYFPLRKAAEGKDYVFKTYDSECKKIGGESIVAYGKAAVSTSLIVTSDTLNWLSSIIGHKKEQAKEAINEKLNN